MFKVTKFKEKESTVAEERAKGTWPPRTTQCGMGPSVWADVLGHRQKWGHGVKCIQEFLVLFLQISVRLNQFLNKVFFNSYRQQFSAF